MTPMTPTTQSTKLRCYLYAALILLAVVALSTSARAAEVTATATATVPVVNVNTASVEQLAYLPGIGPKLAAAICVHRTENGPFPTVDALDNEGMCERIYAQLPEYARW